MAKIIKSLLYVLVIGSLAFLAFYVRFNPAQKTVIKCDSSKVIEIVLRTTKYQIELNRSKTGSEWTVALAQTVSPADQALAFGMAYLVCRLRYIDTFVMDESQGQHLKDYGLENTVKSLTIGFSNGKRVSLKIGDPSLDNSGGFMYVEGEPKRVYLIPALLYRNLQVNYLDLRHKVWMNLDQVASVGIRVNGSELAFTKRPDRTWTSNDPALNQQVVSELLTALTETRYTAYKGPLTDEEIDNWGFEFADFQVIWQDERHRSFEMEVINFGGKYYGLIALGTDRFVLYLESQSTHQVYTSLKDLINN